MAMLGWLPADRRVVSIALAGAGNMNLVERVTLDNDTTVILKRARGWVEKYPDISAPIERAEVEAAFYAAVADSAAGRAMPRHLGFSKEFAANLIADLGEGTDGMSAYAGQIISDDALDAIADWMLALHGLEGPFDDILTNTAMRALNAFHIFDYPLDLNNGLDLDAITPGLQVLADELKQDDSFAAAVKAVGRRYLGSEAGVLLHGDLYPGSWLTTKEGIFVIDPEFCWAGPREWDVGVLVAHLRLSGQPETSKERLIKRYDASLDHRLLDQIVGIEIMRRLIGVAQLPLQIGLEDKAKMLAEARDLVLGTAK
ncbi:phosphotransferase [Erythrobacter donghaensis]|jgi:5-methylthioribose kinase|uniref:phosphotransferase n=1 Tax=Erythrobacter donghaensis TaxID=267135 RepID=UPI00093B6606|nr:phosphotransferase [Erythrobacter donghaensis]